MVITASNATPIDGTPMSEWPIHILSFSAGYWEGKVRVPDRNSTMAEQLFYKQSAQEARKEIQRRRVTEILTK